MGNKETNIERINWTARTETSILLGLMLLSSRLMTEIRWGSAGQLLALFERNGWTTVGQVPIDIRTNLLVSDSTRATPFRLLTAL